MFSLQLQRCCPLQLYLTRMHFDLSRHPSQQEGLLGRPSHGARRIYDSWGRRAVSLEARWRWAKRRKNRADREQVYHRLWSDETIIDLYSALASIIHGK